MTSSSTDIDRFKVFTGTVPFNRDPPTTVAVQILAGIRPERPKHLSLTDELWDLNQRCWDQEPLLRPGISEVVRHLRGALTAVDGRDVRTKWEAVPNSRKNCARPFWIPFGRISDYWRVYDVRQSAQRLDIGASCFVCLEEATSLTSFPTLSPMRPKTRCIKVKLRSGESPGDSHTTMKSLMTIFQQSTSTNVTDLRRASFHRRNRRISCIQDGDSSSLPSPGARWYFSGDDMVSHTEFRFNLHLQVTDAQEI